MGKNGRRLVAEELLTIPKICLNPDFWIFFSKENKKKAESIISQLWSEAKKYAEKREVILYKEDSLSKYRKIAKENPIPKSQRKWTKKKSFQQLKDFRNITPLINAGIQVSKITNE